MLCFNKKLVGKKNQSVSKKHGGFRMVFKLVRKTIFEEPFSFFVMICFFVVVGYNQSLQ